MQSDLCWEACELLQQLMESYVSGSPGMVMGMIKHLSPDILVIGTGKHELYENLAALLQGLEKDQQEAEGIDFVIKNAWYQAKPLAEDICVVYGEFEACEAETEGKQVVINMDTRLTATVHRDAGGQLMIDSLHHSTPYVYQQEGEYYPKTFADQAEAALRRSAALEKDVQLDALTELYNRKYTEKYIGQLLDKGGPGGCLFLLDIDDFKMVNDTYGHQTGDTLLKQIAAVLLRCAGESGVAGRVGGDEFMLFLPDILDERERTAIARQLIAQTGEVFVALELPHSCSIGGASAVGGTSTFAEIYRRADDALYRAKAAGKGVYRSSEDRQIKSCIDTEI